MYPQGQETTPAGRYGYRQACEAPGVGAAVHFRVAAYIEIAPDQQATDKGLGIMQKDKQADLARFTADAKWFDSHYDELLAKYPDQWVGIYHKEVVGASTDGKALIVKLSNDGMLVGRIYTSTSWTASKQAGLSPPAHDTWLLPRQDATTTLH